MSESASLWVIYQPLIVGLGAVALGFVASAAIEFWKDKLNREQARDKLRNALIFDLRMFRQAIELQRFEVPNKDGILNLALYLPVVIEEIDRLEIGSLSYSEVCALADFVRCMDGLRSIVAEDPAAKIQGRYISMDFSAEHTETRKLLLDEFTRTSEHALFELEKDHRNKIDWLTPLQRPTRLPNEKSKSE